MSDNRTRQLAAIMFADMVGYTALMQEDEDEAKAVRDRHRALFSEVVGLHHGKILQYYGDGILTIFSSAVEAVECAVQIQLAVAKKGMTLLRIGIHTGDIVYDELGVYGDGVNVASRIEGLSAAGGVLVSGKVLDEIKNHPSISSLPIGPVRLRDVEHSLSVFAISNDGLAVPTRDEVLAKAEKKAGKNPLPGGPDGESQPGNDPGSNPGMGELFLQRVKERAMVQWTLAYLAGAWALLELAEFASTYLAWNVLVLPGLELLTYAGFFLTIIVAWFHGEKGRQKVGGPEVLLIALLLIATGWGLTSLLPSRGSVGTSGSASVETSNREKQAIAVLPFTNMSAGQTDEVSFLATGLHDDLLTQLSKIAGIDVIARTSVMQYVDTDKPIITIGAELGVHAILEGSLMHAGGQVRLNVQLIDARTDTHIWADTYDREFTVEDVFAIQSDLAGQIAFQLEAEMAPAEEALIAEVPTANLEAYSLFRQGKNLLAKPGTDPTDLATALSFFVRAVEEDPEFSLAHAWLSSTASWEYLFYDRSPEKLQLAREAATEALRLNPHLPEANFARAFHLYHTYENEEASRALEVAEVGTPNDGDLLTLKSEILIRQHRWEESLATRERAVRLDPRNPDVGLNLARALADLGRWDEANREFERILEIHPTFFEGAFIRAFLTWRRTGDGTMGLELLATLPPDVSLYGLKAFFVWLMSDPNEDRVAALEGIEIPILEFGGFWWAPRESIEAWTYQRIDPERARLAFEEAVEICLEALVQQPNDPRIHGTLGRAYAALGRRNEALAEARTVTELLPISVDPAFGRDLLEINASIYAELGMVDEAVEAIETMLTVPGVFPLQTLLEITFDNVRDDPRIQAMIAEHLPPTGS